MELLHKIGAGIIGIYLAITGQSAEPDQLPIEEPIQEEVSLGAFNTVGGKTYSLYGGGIGSTDTSITLSSFKIPVSDAVLNMSHFGGAIGYLTIEPGSASRQEFVSFTNITQNSDGTATLTGVSRGLAPVSPYTASSTYQKAHPGGSVVVISNPPQLYEQFGTLSNDEVITGNWTAPTPTGTSSVATRGFVLNNVTSGNIQTDGVFAPSTAGETFATGTPVYLHSDGEWYKASASVAASSTNVQLGIAQGAGTDGNPITNGVNTFGYDSTQTGMTAGNTIYLSDTAGATSTSAGTYSVILGKARSATTLYFDPLYGNVAGLDYDNAFTANNTFSGTSTFATSTFNATSSVTIGDGPAYRIGKHIQTLTTAGTSTTDFVVPQGIQYLIVEVIGAGGDGVAGTSARSGGGGGGGGYSYEVIDVSATSSISYHVGDNSANRTTFFGSYVSQFVSATGGSDGSNSLGGSGGTGSGGDLNLVGGAGDGGVAVLNTGVNSAGGRGGGSIYGTGGAAGCGQAACGNSQAGGNGASYGSGGGGGGGDEGTSGGTGGTGADGVIIIRW